MSQLREAVVVHGHSGITSAELFVNTDGLPRLKVYGESTANGYTQREVAYYSPTGFPAAWTLSSPTCGELYTAWRDIEAVMERLREAEREVKEEHHG